MTPFDLGPREIAAVVLANAIVGVIAWVRYRAWPAWRAGRDGEESGTDPLP